MKFPLPRFLLALLLTTDIAGARATCSYGMTAPPCTWRWRTTTLARPGRCFGF